MTVRPAKTQISLGICPVWPEPSQSTQWIAKGLSFLHADSEDTDQTGRMPRLIWVFAGRTCHFVGFVTRRLILSWIHSRKPLFHINAGVKVKHTNWTFPIIFTVMFLSFRTERPGQTVQTHIRLLLEEQSDQGLHCLPFRLHRLNSLIYGRAT